MQWLESFLQPKGFGFEPLPELSFSSMNEMDENKFPKLKKGLNCSSKGNHVPKGTRLKLP